jgi:hypothetical protein
MGLDYYFQDEWFFKDHAEAIRALYSADIPRRIERVAIHVRRGANPLMPSEPNYADNPFYVDLTKTDYYERAIAMFPKDKFLVFSDDGTDIQDMNDMAACKAHIIANSSFSWWAAWLSPAYPDNKVVAPKEWYADGDNSRTILPDHWTRI